MHDTSTRYLAGDRKVGPDGSIRLEAIYRNLWLALGMLAGAVCSVALVVSQYPGWLGGSALALPFVLLANRRRVIVFDASRRLVQVTDSAGDTVRVTEFHTMQGLDVVQERVGRLRLLVVNGEAVCELQASYANRELKAELAALIAGSPR
jgi:hypothetical protein